MEDLLLCSDFDLEGRWENLNYINVVDVDGVFPSTNNSEALKSQELHNEDSGSEVIRRIEEWDHFVVSGVANMRACQVVQIPPLIADSMKEKFKMQPDLLAFNLLESMGGNDCPLFSQNAFLANISLEVDEETEHCSIT